MDRYSLYRTFGNIKVASVSKVVFIVSSSKSNLESEVLEQTSELHAPNTAALDPHLDGPISLSCLCWAW